MRLSWQPQVSACFKGAGDAVCSFLPRSLTRKACGWVAGFHSAQTLKNKKYNHKKPKLRSIENLKHMQKQGE